MLPDRAIRTNPSFPWLDAERIESVESLLLSLDWLGPQEQVRSITSAGDGNMNLTLRVVTSERSFILKQSRPWVEKYPHITAPWDRMIQEYAFYRRAGSLEHVGLWMPQTLAFASHARMIMLEDLGDWPDGSIVYHGRRLPRSSLSHLSRWLAALHQGTQGTPDPELANREMRKLNHAHIFQIPWEPGGVAALGLDLDGLEAGLCEAANALQRRAELRARAKELGDAYLSEGPCLLHGDFFPGSFVTTGNGLFIIDPEFSYFGDPAFDVGVFIAHLAISGHTPEDASTFIDAYQRAWPGGTINARLASGFAACEVIRRLIGVAQLPLRESFSGRRDMLARAARALETSRWKELFE